MSTERPGNRLYSQKRRSNTTALVFAAIALVMMVTMCMVANRDAIGPSAPAPAPSGPFQTLR